MAGGFAFGKTIGVERSLCLYLSLLCFRWLLIKRLWWLIFGIQLERKGSPLFARTFNDWEMEEVQIFLQVLQGKRVIMDQEDALLMKDVKDGHFSVKHFYLLLATVQESLFPFCFVWNP